MATEKAIVLLAHIRGERTGNYPVLQEKIRVIATSASHLSFMWSLQHISTLYPLEMCVSLSQCTSKKHDIKVVAVEYKNCCEFTSLLI